jgi:hypothetical protein
MLLHIGVSVAPVLARPDAFPAEGSVDDRDLAETRRYEPERVL